MTTPTAQAADCAVVAICTHLCLTVLPQREYATWLGQLSFALDLSITCSGATAALRAAARDLVEAAPASRASCEARLRYELRLCMARASAERIEALRDAVGEEVRHG